MKNYIIFKFHLKRLFLNIEWNFYIVPESSSNKKKSRRKFKSKSINVSTQLQYLGLNNNKFHRIKIFTVYNMYNVRISYIVQRDMLRDKEHTAQFPLQN